MTGYGDARGQTDTFVCQIEVRSVNNRHLKLMLRAPEPFNLLEAEFEKVVRRFVRRGTLLIQLRIDRNKKAEDFRIDQVALRSYLKQIHDAWTGLDKATRPSLESLVGQVVALPGVAVEPGFSGVTVEDEWPALETTLTEALTRLQKMREDEGQRMSRELVGYRDQIAGHLAGIRERQPAIVPAYRDRLRERVQALIAESGVKLADHDLLREIAVFADRSDISEEITRLDSHLVQFGEILGGKDDSIGRKLEFVTQEMGRETNTIGSKAADVGISRQVVDIKAILEKIRELLQNVE